MFFVRKNAILNPFGNSTYTAKRSALRKPLKFISTIL